MFLRAEQSFKGHMYICFSQSTEILENYLNSVFFLKIIQYNVCLKPVLFIFISLHMLKWHEAYKVSADIERWLTDKTKRRQKKKTNRQQQQKNNNKPQHSRKMQNIPEFFYTG